MRRICFDYVWALGFGPVCMSVIDSNMMGISARERTKGDVLAILNGAKLPFLLRRQEDLSYRVIDICLADYTDSESPFDFRRAIPETDFVLS